MTETFVDSFFWIATINPKDVHHQWALRTPKPQRIVTSDAVLLEVMNTFHASRWRKVVVDFWRALKSDPDTLVIPVDHNLLNRGVDLLENRHDKDWSLTDCTSFLIMEARGITDALTGDRHFVQAGFRMLFP